MKADLSRFENCPLARQLYRYVYNQVSKREVAQGTQQDQTLGCSYKKITLDAKLAVYKKVLDYLQNMASTHPILSNVELLHNNHEKSKLMINEINTYIDKMLNDSRDDFTSTDIYDPFKLAALIATHIAYSDLHYFIAAMHSQEIIK